MKCKFCKKEVVSIQHVLLDCEPIKEIWSAWEQSGVLEDTFWSPWPWPRGSSFWPWPRSLKSSKIGLSSARGQHHFLNRWIFVGKRGILAENLQKPFSFGGRLKKILKTFFFGEHLRLCSWPRAFLSLASRGSVLGRAVLGLGIFFVPLALASSLVSSTTPLLCKIS